MAEANYLYSRFALNLLRGNVGDLEDEGTKVKVALLQATYTFDQHMHDSWASVSAYEASGPGYTSGGDELVGKQVVQGEDVITFLCAAVDLQGRHALWGVEGQTGEAISIVARYGVIYDDTPTEAADKKLIAFLDFGEEREAYQSEFGITFHEEGIFRCTVATPL